MKKIPLFQLLACGVMDLCWYYAWATFLTLAVLHRPFPFPEAVGAFALAGALTRFSSGRGWRVIWTVALQAAFFLPGLLMAGRIFLSWSTSYTEQTWLIDSSFSAAAARVWFMFLLVNIWIFTFWGGGIRLSLRPGDYETVCLRFDRGLAAFFILLLAKFLLLPQLKLHVEGSGLEYLLFSFFLFSMLAIGLSKNRATAAPRDYIPGYRGLGVILGFMVVIILSCAGLIFFCLPYLTGAVETSYVLMKKAAGPVGTFLLMILRFLFGIDDDWHINEQPKKAVTMPKLDSYSSHHWFWELMGKIVAWLVGFILVAVIAAVIGAILYLLVRWLFSYTEADRATPPRPLPRWLERIRSFLQTSGQAILRLCNPPQGIMSLYAALQRWGRRSGLPRFPCETPSEYAWRLQSLFPALSEEFKSITETYNQQVYGGITPERQLLRKTRLAWTRMRRPRHWPRRLKSWLLPATRTS